MPVNRYPRCILKDIPMFQAKIASHGCIWTAPSGQMEPKNMFMCTRSWIEVQANFSMVFLLIIRCYSISLLFCSLYFIQSNCFPSWRIYLSLTAGFCSLIIGFVKFSPLYIFIVGDIGMVRILYWFSHLLSNLVNKNASTF